MGRRTKKQEERLRKKRARREQAQRDGKGTSKYAQKRGAYRPNATWWFSRGEIDEHRPGVEVSS